MQDCPAILGLEGKTKVEMGEEEWTGGPPTNNEWMFQL